MSLNQCTFIGNAGRDTEVRYTTNGDPVANVSIGVNYRSKDEEKTEWVNLVFYGKTAEIAGEYVTKGKQVCVTGRLQSRKWQDKDGNDRYTTEIVVNNLVLLGGREEGGGGRGRDDDRGDRRPPSRESGGRTHGEMRRDRTAGYGDDRGGDERRPPPRREEPARRPPPKSNTGFDDMDDDIPF